MITIEDYYSNFSLNDGFKMLQTCWNHWTGPASAAAILDASSCNKTLAPQELPSGNLT